jgi:hypothetical protein
VKTLTVAIHGIQIVVRAERHSLSVANESGRENQDFLLVNSPALGSMDIDGDAEATSQPTC